MHSSLRHHRKTERLIRLLNAPRPHVIGYLDLLWATVQDQRGPDQDGILTGWTAEDVAIAAEYPGEPVAFVEALVSAGFLDQTPTADGDDTFTYAIHDYVAWMPRHIQERLRKRIVRNEPETFRTMLRTGGGQVAESTPRVDPHVHVHEQNNMPASLVSTQSKPPGNGRYPRARPQGEDHVTARRRAEARAKEQAEMEQGWKDHAELIRREAAERAMKKGQNTQA